MATRRAHVVVPEKLIEEVDALVGKRRRGAFFVEAAEERLKREQLLAAIDAVAGSIPDGTVAEEGTVDALTRKRRVAAFERVAGSIADGAVPEWDTVEGVKAWVRSMREERDPWADVPEGDPDKPA
jgi:hypothetical protein